MKLPKLSPELLEDISKIRNVCYECGVSANVVTCLRKYRSSPDKLAYSLSTYHSGNCDFCGQNTQVTEARDFFYPDFKLLASLIAYFEETKGYEE